MWGRLRVLQQVNEYIVAFAIGDDDAYACPLHFLDARAQTNDYYGVSRPAVPRTTIPPVGGRLRRIASATGLPASVSGYRL